MLHCSFEVIDAWLDMDIERFREAMEDDEERCFLNSYDWIYDVLRHGKKDWVEGFDLIYDCDLITEDKSPIVDELIDLKYYKILSSDVGRNLVSDAQTDEGYTRKIITKITILSGIIAFILLIKWSSFLNVVFL